MPGKPDIYQALEHSEAIPANLPQPQAVTSAMNDLTNPSLNCTWTCLSHARAAAITNALEVKLIRPQ
jgi:hypothetical protein